MVGVQAIEYSLMQKVTNYKQECEIFDKTQCRLQTNKGTITIRDKFLS